MRSLQGDDSDGHRRMQAHHRRNGQAMALNNNEDSIVLLNQTGQIVDRAEYYSADDDQELVFQ